jgi:hypothetical protein
MIGNLTILVCLYNKDIIDSATLQSLLKSQNVRENATVFIWDNSIKAVNSESFFFLKSNFKNLIYKHTPENTVLSKIYNHVINNLESNSYLMLCDDDSDIPVVFFDILSEQINFNPSQNLFLPQIYSEGVLVSPAKDFLIRTQLINNLKSGVLKSLYTTAINSGMVISNRVFQQGFRYDENLRFYGTDNFFMYQYSKKNNDLIVLDVKFSHSLSFHSSNDVKNKLRIFKEIRSANDIIYSKDFIKRKIVFFNNLIVAAKMCLKYKTLDFLYY